MKRAVLLFFMLFMLINISSCSITKNIILPIETHVDYEGEGYYRKKDFSESYENIYHQEPKCLDYSIYSNIYYKFHYLKSTGKQKILVIPVEFSDYHASNLKGGEEGSLRYIENAFFGETSKTFFESVSSYYYKSSYGQLTLEGKVSSWFKINKTVEQIKNESIYPIQSQHVLQEAIKWYYKNYDDIDEFDQDKDGYIDAVWLIYSAPQKNSDYFLWAHTYSDYSDNYGNIKPRASAYSWASYNFLFYQTSKPETHVLIHETGHLFGLKDYYSTDNGENKYAPTAYFDMMDTNIGDHNAFSKLLLNWTTPYVVKDECEITISSFTESGECILLSPSWNGSAMDEYLLLEYYTPTYLQSADSKTRWEYKNLSSRGLRVYHVDARIGYVRNFGGHMDGYLGVDEVQDIHLYHLDFANTNTTSSTTYSSGKPNYLLKLLRAKDYEKEGTPADNELLFKVGDKFIDRINDDNYPFSFNSFDSIPFTFEVIKMTKKSITVKFTKTN